MSTILYILLPSQSLLSVNGEEVRRKSLTPHFLFTLVLAIMSSKKYLVHAIGGSS